MDFVGGYCLVFTAQSAVSLENKAKPKFFSNPRKSIDCHANANAFARNDGGYPPPNPLRLREGVYAAKQPPQASPIPPYKHSSCLALGCNQYLGFIFWGYNAEFLNIRILICICKNS